MILISSIPREKPKKETAQGRKTEAKVKPVAVFDQLCENQTRGTSPCKAQRGSNGLNFKRKPFRCANSYEALRYFEREFRVFGYTVQV